MKRSNYPYRLETKLEDTGKTFGKSKRKAYWKFGWSYDLRECEIHFTHSVVSGKRSIFEDNRQILTCHHRLSSGDFEHEWTSNGCKLKITHTSTKEVLFSINDVNFNDFVTKPSLSNAVIRGTGGNNDEWRPHQNRIYKLYNDLDNLDHDRIASMINFQVDQRYGDVEDEHNRLLGGGQRNVYNTANLVFEPPEPYASCRCCLLFIFLTFITLISIATRFYPLLNDNWLIMSETSRQASSDSFLHNASYASLPSTEPTRYATEDISPTFFPTEQPTWKSKKPLPSSNSPSIRPSFSPSKPNFRQSISHSHHVDNNELSTPAFPELPANPDTSYQEVDNPGNAEIFKERHVATNNKDEDDKKETGIEPRTAIGETKEDRKEQDEQLEEPRPIDDPHHDTRLKFLNKNGGIEYKVRPSS